ncbi:unnamed protein product [Closterium sp. Naga37s-1]|nr:unnamed protein product [Closterium sp. Naga37s-1]
MSIGPSGISMGASGMSIGVTNESTKKSPFPPPLPSIFRIAPMGAVDALPTTPTAAGAMAVTAPPPSTPLSLPPPIPPPNPPIPPPIAPVQVRLRSGAAEVRFSQGSLFGREFARHLSLSLPQTPPAKTDCHLSFRLPFSPHPLPSKALSFTHFRERLSWRADCPISVALISSAPLPSYKQGSLFDCKAICMTVTSTSTSPSASSS